MYDPVVIGAGPAGLFTSLRLAQGGLRGIMAGAISPDGKWVVTSPLNVQPTLGVWSVSNGALKREVHLEGSLNELAIERAIVRVAFSQSGEYLTASNAHYAYLLRFSELIEGESSR